MNQDQRRALRVPELVCGHDTRTNNRSQLCKSWLQWRDVLGKRKKKKEERSNDRKRGEKEASRGKFCAHAGARISPVNVFEGAAQCNGVKFRCDPRDSYGNNQIQIRDIGLTDFHAGSRARCRTPRTKRNRERQTPHAIASHVACKNPKFVSPECRRSADTYARIHLPVTAGPSPFAHPRIPFRDLHMNSHWALGDARSPAARAL